MYVELKSIDRYCGTTYCKSRFDYVDSGAV